ncbi:MAG: pentapeptide repeat-containing protein [Deltaproteobacteria bacterium]|nr:pentapeptide repeat-containing protein [Deltaproteobacteria bacterium]
MPPSQITSQPPWTPQESWVWEKICAKEIADFNREAAYGGPLDPKKPEGWNSDRLLSAKFLQNVLLSESYRQVIPATGVRICGAWFQDSLDFSFAKLSQALWLSNCRFESNVVLRRFETSGLIVLSGSKFVRALNMNSIKIGQDLMHQGAEFAEVDLRGAKIEGQVDMMGSRFAGTLNMGTVRISRDLLMDKGEFAEVDVRGGKIEGQVDMSRSKFTGWLNMNGLHVGQSLFMRDKAEFTEVNLTGAEIEGQVDMSRSKFTGSLNMNGLRVGQHLLMCDGAEFADVDLGGAQIEGQIEMRSSKFGGRLNMASLKLRQGLFMREKAQFGQVDLVAAKIDGQIDMRGSNFTGKLNMDSLRVGEHLFMRDGAEFTEVELTGARIAGVLDTTNSKFTGKLNMNSFWVGQHLLMGKQTEFAEVDLSAANIGGVVSMIGCKFRGKLNMNSLRVGQHLLMRNGAEFTEVGLTAAKIEGYLDIGSSKFVDKLNMNRVEIRRNLFMRDGAEFTEVDLTSANIGGQVDLTRSKFTGKLNMDSLRVGEQLLMREKAEFAWLGKEYPICLVSGEIGGDMVISDSQFPSLDLTGTKIHGELRLGSDIEKPVRWHQEATLILRNTHVAALQDTEDAWPEKIKLDGFTYSRLGGLAGDFSQIAKRKGAWFISWLAKSEYSPQPYGQLGEVLQKAGYKEMANQVLYAGKQREKKGSSWRRWLWMLLQDMFIGYGFKLERSLYWVIGLTALGTVILTWSDQGPTPHAVLSRIFYTLNMLLPVIQLDKAYDNVTLTGYTQIYFYVHKILGYFIGFFIIAGLSGLTKK